MQLKLFTIPVLAVNEYNNEINSFLKSNRILETEKHLVQTPQGTYWCLCFTYLEKNELDKTAKNRVDYMKELDSEVFEKFSHLRKIRKKIAFKENVSAFVIFTDAELAEIAKLPQLTVKSLRAIKGIGDTKAEKYGAMLIYEYEQQNDETHGQPDSTDSRV